VSELKSAAKIIDKAKSIVITAGAGMGVDSGLPDFRGPQGFWRAYPALRGHSFEDMANPAWFYNNPRRAWGFYGHRLNLYRETIPHKGFDILLRWVENKKYFVFTSNVDGAFQKAGFSSSAIVECHGSINYLQYVDAKYGRSIWSADNTDVVVDEKVVLADEPLPSRNGRLLRPNILMFGDMEWVSDRASKQEKKLRNWIQNQDLRQCVVIEMGAGLAIPTTRYFSEQLQSLGATLIRINPREEKGPDGTISIAKGACDALVSIDRLVSI
jgi:NAD-dependent SIR2 family protein deacetylase